MWTIGELKQRAKANLKRYFWAAFFVSLIFELLRGGFGRSVGSANSGVNADTNILEEYSVRIPEGMSGLIGSVPESGDYLFDSLESAISSVNPIFWGVLAGALIVGLMIGIALSIFVIPAMEVGKARFYMESRGIGTSAGFSRLFWGFNRNYLNIIWTIFLKNLIVALGSFCCVIPGIYFSYCYYMVPYILAENPDMKAADVLRLSKDMMEGQKLNTCVLELSFLGWWILGFLFYGIGSFFVRPYYDATMAELYAVSRQRFSYTLNGFGYPDYGPAGGYNGYHDGGWNEGNDNSGNYNSGYGNNGYDNGGCHTDGGSYYERYDNGSHSNGYEQSGYYNEPSGSSGQYYTGGYDPYGRAEDAGENSGWQPDGGQYTAQGEHADLPADAQADRNLNVKRSEGGPGRGYYLNGEFHPYTEDELNEMDKK